MKPEPQTKEQIEAELSEAFLARVNSAGVRIAAFVVELDTDPAAIVQGMTAALGSVLATYTMPEHVEGMLAATAEALRARVDMTQDAMARMGMPVVGGLRPC